MPTANPLEQLRRRMLSHASPAAFAAAAEEHRRAGRFAEAIAVCRDGLDRYPAYASARVTLGRALLDSGDPAAAVTELEQAVAQAPDNLAASRALEAARAAVGSLPAPPAPADPPPLDPVADLAFQHTTPVDDDTGEFAAPILPDLAAGSWGVAEVAGPPPLPPLPQVGADSPQEFGLGPDWLPTGPGLGPDPNVPPLPVDVASVPAMPELAPTDAPLQGEEPAGIWQVPALDVPDGGSAGAPVYSWALDPSPEASAVAPPAPSIWDEPTIDAPLTDFAVPASMGALADAPPVEAPVAPIAHADADLSADPGGTGAFTGLFVEPVSEGAAPAAFVGWDAEGPSTSSTPTWSDAPAAEPVTSAFTVPGLWGDVPAPADPSSADGASQSAAEVASVPPSCAPDWSVPVDAATATPEAMGEWTMFVTPVPVAPPAGEPVVEAGPAEAPAWGLADLPAAIDAAPADLVEPLDAFLPEPVAVSEPLATVDAAAAAPPTEPETPAASMWAGSVASALDEVFSQAGHAAEAGHPSLEPPMHPSAHVREAMADTAVEATLEDVAQQTDTLPPALASLQQMLDAVRARRAALHAEMKH